MKNIKNQPATTTKIVHTKVEYVTIDVVGFFDIIVKYVNGIEVKRFKQQNRFK
jgi:hypothetical protein